MVFRKARQHGGNIQALATPTGFPAWVSDVGPGSVHDVTAAREHVLGALYWAASQLALPTPADNGYDEAGIGVFTPVKLPADGQVLDVDTRTYNTLLRSLRCLGEADSPCSPAAGAPCDTSPPPRKISHTVEAALVLTHFEHGMTN
uniref:transposase family protein n=1 Tax=Streptomyces winkii TaxID=3051178 RepID=UPI0037DA40BA